MTTSRESDLDWEQIAAQLPVGFRELADEMGLLRERPAHMKTKVRDVGVALRLVLHQAGTSSSLRATAALASATGVVSMSAVSLHQWMKKLGPYLTALLAQMVPTTSVATAMGGGFHVIGGDATTVQRPGSKGTTARVHYALRLADLTPRHIEATARPRTSGVRSCTSAMSALRGGSAGCGFPSARPKSPGCAPSVKPRGLATRRRFTPRSSSLCSRPSWTN